MLAIPASLQLVIERQEMAVFESGLPGLLIILALTIVLFGPAPLIRGWEWLRRRAQDVMRSERSKPLQEE